MLRQDAREYTNALEAKLLELGMTKDELQAMQSDTMGSGNDEDPSVDLVLTPLFL